MATDEEKKYFKQKELEQRDLKRRELDRAARESQENRKVAATLATDDSDLVERIRALGFDGDTARVLDLLPLIHVAWADGSVTQKERNSILEVLEARGIERDSEAWLLVEALLEQRPSATFLDETLHLLRELGGNRQASIVDLCVQVAAASGGFFGLGEKISDAEQAVISRIASELGEAAIQAFSEKL